MTLTILGNDASCPSANGACSCYLLEAENKKILIDMGNGSTAKIQQKMDLAQLDAIVISHLHFDHFGDLFCAKYQLETRAACGEKIKKIPLLIPGLPHWAKTELVSNDMFQIITVTGGFSWVLPESDISIAFTGMKHLIESYGLRVQSEGRIFAYSGDTGLCDQIYSVANGADLFLCESTFLSGKEESAHHLSAESAAQIARESGVRLLVLTHLQHKMHSQLLLSARKYFDRTAVSDIFSRYSV